MIPHHGPKSLEDLWFPVLSNGVENFQDYSKIGVNTIENQELDPTVVTVNPK